MSDDHGQDTFVLLPRYAACYLALAVITAISIWLLLQLRTLIVQIGIALGLNNWTMTVVDQFGFILLGLLWLIAFFVVEAYLRHGVPSNQVWPHAGKILTWEMFLIFFVFAGLQITS